MSKEAGSDADEGRRDETEEERLDRNLSELLQELRIAIPGIQFLFAFLLVVPFQQGWPQINEVEKGIYYGTLLSTAAAATLLIAPTARHRLRFRARDKKWVVASSNRLALAGLAMLAISVTGVIILVSSVVYDGVVAAIAGACVLLAMGWMWFGRPIARGGGIEATALKEDP